MFKNNKKGFTLVELLAVIVILAVVILIAVTAVIPRMNNAKKKALVDEALMYLKAAKESIVFDADQSPSCINVSNLNEKYIKKSSDSYTGVVKNEYVNGELSQTINLTNGSLYIVGTDNLTSSDVKSTMPKGFASSCADYNPILAENADTNNIAYKLLMSEGGSTLDANLNVINQRTATVDFNNVETNTSKSGLYKAEDDDGASFYYRGVVNNNWLEFGGFYWRIVRINGDGSVRLIYSGLKNSSHSGDDASIVNSKGTYTTSFAIRQTYKDIVPDISGLTSSTVQVNYSNGRNGTTYVGYMYNPAKVPASYHNEMPSNTRKIDQFVTFSNITQAKNDYYFFKNFDMSNDCFIGNGNDDTGSCTLKCRKLGNDGDTGIDCVSSNWNTLATTEGNYSTTAEGTSSTTYKYTSEYKYTCWGYGTPVTKTNSDGTTSVYISCPVVSEIIGTVKDKSSQAKVILKGLFSQSVDTSKMNVADSNAKKELDIWYENNILNKNDGKLSPSNLEEYIADEIFCNDRSSITSDTDFPITYSNAGAYFYNGSRRNILNTQPILKCPNINSDAFTLSSDINSSSVTPKNIGNKLLKYPIGLITADEATYAGGKVNVENTSYYLHTGKTYLTMTPDRFTPGSIYAYIIGVYDNGKISNPITSSEYGLRPVINLKSSVLYDSGSGTEADPYKVKLAS